MIASPTLYHYATTPTSKDQRLKQKVFSVSSRQKYTDFRLLSEVILDEKYAAFPKNFVKWRRVIEITLKHLLHSNWYISEMSHCVENKIDIKLLP